MADPKFRILRGLEANLPSTKTDGYVYVTTDTRAMYVDYMNANSELARIRIGDVLTVADVASLPAVASAQDGVLYYCTAENILCTPSGSGSGRAWKQINKQQTLDTIITGMTFTAAEVTDGASMTVKLTGGGSTKTAELGVAEGSNVEVTVANSKLKIGAKDTTITGALSAESSDGGATVKLTNTTGGTDAAGTALSGTAVNGSFAIVGDGAKVTYADNKITINGKETVANTFDANGAFTTKLTFADNSTASSTAVTPKVMFGENADQEVTFKSGTATLDVYTTDETDAKIDAKLKAANAMTFKGTMGSTGATVTALPSSAALGDTYIVSEKATYSYKAVGASAATSQSCQVGDMFIAGPGEEDSTTGLLKTLCWTYVPAGNDDLPVASATANASGITFKSTLANETTTVGVVSVGSGLKGTASGTTLTVAHGDIAAATTTAGAVVAQTAGTAKDYTAITGVTLSNGHVTGYQTTKLSVVDTVLSDASLTAAAATNGATVTLAVKDSANNSKGNAVTIKASGNSAASVSVDSGVIVVDTVWGTF